MNRILTPEERGALGGCVAEAVARIEALNLAFGPDEGRARLQALAALSRLDTESLLHFASFVTQTGLGDEGR